MSWTAPRTWTAGEIVTASIMNTHARDNLRYLKGLDGTVTLSDGLDLGANELTINSLETVGVDGIVNKEQMEDHSHQDAANCGTLDHGLAITGLTDDDHTQYQLKSLLTTQGDIIYATTASTWARLGKGTANQVLRVNAGETAPEWGSKTNIVFDTTEVFNGTAPTSMTDLDLSAVVGSNQAVCLLKVYNNSGDATTLTIKFKKNGETDILFSAGVSTSNNLGIADDQFFYALVITDSSGIVEWRANQAKTVVITMEAYLV